MSAPATKAPATPPLRVLTFESDRPPRPTANLPPVVQKVWRLAERWPIRAAVVEELVDRLLKP